MKSFFVYPNMRKDGAKETLPLVCRLLGTHGARIILPLQLRNTVLDLPDADYMDEDAAVRVSDLAVILGGDGTMLRIARAAAQQELPLLGINLGHIGFMTELERDELGQMEKLFTDCYTIDSRMMLHVALWRGGRIIYENDALNDVVMAKGTAFRVVRVRIEADEETVTHFNGDGVIVSTPTGTTAYGLSAGGPIIEPSAENLAVIPICAHALKAKAFVFAPERRIRLAAACEGGSEVFLSCDGGQSVAVRPDDCVEITRSALRSRLVRLKGDSFYKILLQKL